MAGLTLDETEVLVRALTRWFQLVNLAEDNERVRRLRARDAADPERPRVGSLRHVVAALHQSGATGDDLADVLDNAELRLVMTAHPTEARRRTTIDKLARVFGVLRELDERSHAPAGDARRRLLATVQELWGSDDLRAAELTVSDEVRGGLIHFSSTLADAIPRIYRDLEEAVAEFYPGGRGPPARGAAAAELRLLDRGRPGRQPVRHPGDDGGGSSSSCASSACGSWRLASSSSPGGCRCHSG